MKSATGGLLSADTNPKFGARPLKRMLQRPVLNELSKSILSGEIKKDSVVLMELNDEGEIAFTNLDAEIDRAAERL